MQNLQLQILWLNDSLGFCVNYKIAKTVIPLTGYYFWPISDAWEQLKVELDSKNWLPVEERVKFLNLVVETMDSWQQSSNDFEINKFTKENVNLSGNLEIRGLS
jgi:30S ribosomal protein 3